jgi:hypothetical protein
MSLIGIAQHDRLDSLVQDMMSSTSELCLTPKARALRRQIAAWSIALATSGEDYIINELGGRLYGSAKTEQLVFPLLEELGLGASHNIKDLGAC